MNLARKSSWVKHRNICINTQCYLPALLLVWLRPLLALCEWEAQLHTIPGVHYTPVAPEWELRTLLIFCHQLQYSKVHPFHPGSKKQAPVGPHAAYSFMQVSVSSQWYWWSQGLQGPANGVFEPFKSCCIESRTMQTLWYQNLRSFVGECIE